MREFAIATLFKGGWGIYMDIKRKLLNHYQRWEIEFDGEQAFIKFKNRVATIIKSHFSIIPKIIDDKFAFLYGCHVDIIPSGYLGYDLRSSYLYTVVSTVKSTRELATALQCFFITLEAIGYPDLLVLAEAVKEAIELSPGVGLKLVRQKTSVMFLPVDAKFSGE
jgi:hypothetical protein